MEERELKALDEKFRGKFSLNPLTRSKTPFLPERCMSYGCAKWAVESSISFVDNFGSQLGIEPVFNSIKDSLTTGDRRLNSAPENGIDHAQEGQTPSLPSLDAGSWKAQTQ